MPGKACREQADHDKLIKGMNAARIEKARFLLAKDSLIGSTRTIHHRQPGLPETTIHLSGILRVRAISACPYTSHSGWQ